MTHGAGNNSRESYLRPAERFLTNCIECGKRKKDWIEVNVEYKFLYSNGIVQITARYRIYLPAKPFICPFVDLIQDLSSPPSSNTLWQFRGKPSLYIHIDLSYIPDIRAIFSHVRVAVNETPQILRRYYDLVKSLYIVQS